MLLVYDGYNEILYDVLFIYWVLDELLNIILNDS